MRFTNILLLFFGIKLCIGVQCEWGKEYLCGDLCLPVTNHFCICGEYGFDYALSGRSACCHHWPCERAEQNGYNYAICDGKVQHWSEVCVKNNDTMTCLQNSKWGFTRSLCKDRQQCYTDHQSCNGNLQCSE